MKTFSKPLFVFEMANNHQGDIEHGKNIIRAMRQAAAPFADRFDFAVKFQYRDLDSFIHPAFKDRMDIKNVKRFQDTRLSREQFAELLACTREEGFLTMCTPFDEVSAARIAGLCALRPALAASSIAWSTACFTLCGLGIVVAALSR